MWTGCFPLVRQAVRRPRAHARDHQRFSADEWVLKNTLVRSFEIRRSKHVQIQHASKKHSKTCAKVRLSSAPTIQIVRTRAISSAQPQFATTENVNFMASARQGAHLHADERRSVARSCSFPQMVIENTDNHETAFTVSMDHVDTTTGISAAERGLTARKVVDQDAKPTDFRRPGHMFPLMAKPNGVLERNGHTEATVDLVPPGRPSRRAGSAVRSCAMTAR